MTDLQLTELTADDTAGLEARCDLLVALAVHDFPYGPRPSRRDHLAVLAFPWSHERSEHWLAAIDGEVVGTVDLGFPLQDNTDNTTVAIAVHPGRRREGIGRLLCEHAVGRARAGGRKRLVVEICTDGPTEGDHPGAAYATAMGATEALAEVRRRLLVAQADREALRRHRAAAEEASAGYELVRWESRIPDDVIEGVATLEGRMVIDAPMGDLAWEQEKIDVARLREVERVVRGRGRRTYGIAAVHEATRTVAGFTICALDEDVPEHAWQWSTIVLPEHRGHRLGLRLKAEQTLWLLEAEPALATFDTWNAAENSHMIKVNDLLGYRPLDTWAEWQLDID